MTITALKTNKTPKLAVALMAVGLLVTGCDTVDRDNAALGGVAGAVIGGVSTGTLEGAAVGGAIGAGTAVLIGRVLDGSGLCWYRGRDGRRFKGRCR